jgi:AraC-like DNA-binding protein
MPPLAVALARAAGWDAALSLVWACGGRTVELPAATRVGRSWLALAVGADAARAMLPVLEDRASDSGRINLPSRATVTASIRIACVGYLSDQGHSRARIASVLGLSERTVYRHLSKRRNDQSPKE